ADPEIETESLRYPPPRDLHAHLTRSGKIEAVRPQTQLGPELRLRPAYAEPIPQAGIDVVVEAAETRVDVAPGVAARSPRPGTDVPGHVHAALRDRQMHPAAVANDVEERPVGVNIHLEVTTVDLRPHIDPRQFRVEEPHRAREADIDLIVPNVDVRPAGE